MNKKEVLKLIAEYIGVEVDEIKEEDSFVDDFHMNPADFTDLLEKLSSEGEEIEKLKLREINTVMDLLEALEVEDL